MLQIEQSWRNVNQNLEGGLGSGPAAVRMSSDRFDVFVRTTRQRLAHISTGSGGTSAWFEEPEIGGHPFQSDPAAAASRDGKIEVFVRDAADHLLKISYTDANRFFHPVSIYPELVVSSSPSVVSTSVDRFSIFARNRRGFLTHISYSPYVFSTTLTNLDYAMTSDPAASLALNGLVDVSAQENDVLWKATQ